MSETETAAKFKQLTEVGFKTSGAPTERLHSEVVVPSRSASPAETIRGEAVPSARMDLDVERVYVVNVYLRSINGTDITARKPTPYIPMNDEVDLSTRTMFVFVGRSHAHHFALQAICSIYSERMAGRVKLGNILRAGGPDGFNGEGYLNFAVEAEEAGIEKGLYIFVESRAPQLGDEIMDLHQVNQPTRLLELLAIRQDLYSIVQKGQHYLSRSDVHKLVGVRGVRVQRRRSLPVVRNLKRNRE